MPEKVLLLCEYLREESQALQGEHAALIMYLSVVSFYTVAGCLGKGHPGENAMTFLVRNALFCGFVGHVTVTLRITHNVLAPGTLNHGATAYMCLPVFQPFTARTLDSQTRKHAAVAVIPKQMYHLTQPHHVFAYLFAVIVVLQSEAVSCIFVFLV
jgi:hypothetical protein